MDEARSLTYSINVKAVVSKAEEDIRSFVGTLGKLREEAAGVIDIKLDIGSASDSLRDLTSDIGNLQSEGADVKVGADTTEAEENIRELTSDIGSLGERSADIDIEVDTEQAQTDVQSLADRVTNLGQDPPDIDIDVDTTDAQQNIRDLTEDLGDLETDADGIGSAFRKSFLAGIDGGDSFAASLRSGVVGALTAAGERAGGLGSAFNSSFRAGIDSGNSLASSLKSGLGGALDYAKDKAVDLKDNIVEGAKNIGHGFAHPIETIKSGLGNALQSAKNKFIDLARGADTAADGAEDMGDAADDAAADVTDLGNATEKSGDAAEKSGGKFEKLGGVLKGLGAAVTAASVAVGAFAGASVGVGMNFDSSMSQVAATMGYSVEELNTVGSEANKTFTELRGFAMEMGATTAFSASEAADALNYMALAGYDSEKSMAMLPNVLNLAAAGGIELAAASDMVTDAQSALGLTMDETTELVDKMAMASSKSNTSVEQLGNAVLAIGGTAKNLAGGTTELSTALGILADNGIKGAEGGTHLRNIILSLGSPTDTAAKALSKLGVEVFDAEGKMRPLNETFGDLNDALSTMSQGDRLAAIGDIFNTTDIASVNALLGTSAERWDELGTAIGDASGAAGDMAKTQLDNLAGDITMFKSALEGAQIVISDQLTPDLRKFTQFGTEAISTLSTAFQEGGLSGAMGALGGILSDAVGMIVDMLPSMVDAGVQLLGALGEGLLSNVPVLIEAATQIVVTLAEGLSSSMSGLDSSGNETLTRITDSLIENLPVLIGAAGQIIITLASGIGSALPDLIPSVVETLLVVVSTIIENLPLILDAGMQILGGLTQGIIEAIPILVEQLPEIILQIVGFLSESLPTILEQGSQMLLSLGMGIIEAIPQLVAQLPAIISSVVGFITENLPLIVETGVNLIVQLGVGLIEAIPSLVAQLPQIISAIVGGFAELPGMMLDIGKNVVKGVWDGISAMGSWIKEKVTGFFGGIVDGVKGLLGIHSPSTVFAGIGDNMAAGLGQGFGKTMEGVTKDIKGAIPTNFELPDINGPDPDSLVGNVSDELYHVSPIVDDVNTPEVPDITYGVKPLVDGSNPPSVADELYHISPIVDDVNTPAVPDITYGVKPLVDSFNPPSVVDVEGPRNLNEPDDYDPSAGEPHNPSLPDLPPPPEGSGGGGGGGFALPPVNIYITVEGSADEAVVEDLKTKLHDTVKELFEEFRNEENEEMALKEQYAF